jgi:hypothetical protein
MDGNERSKSFKSFGGENEEVSKNSGKTTY